MSEETAKEETNSETEVSMDEGTPESPPIGQKNEHVAPKSKAPKSSIATRLILRVVLATLVVAVGISTWSLNKDNKTLRKNTRNSVIGANTTTNKATATAMYAEDEDQVKNAIQGLLKNPNIVDVKIYSADDLEGIEELELTNETKLKPLEGEPSVKLEKASKDSEASFKGENFKVPYDDALVDASENFFFQFPVTYKDEGDDTAELEKIGLIRIGGTYKIADLKIEDTIKLFSIMQLCQVAVIVAAVLFLFKRLVAVHLKKMSDYAEHMDLNDLTGPELELDRSKGSSNDELDDLVGSFNYMRSNLKEAYASLQDYAENLEAKVEAATKDIMEEKKKVANLLNSMKQAIFSIDADFHVVAPVSHYTEEVFKQDMVGKHIYETVFKDVDRTSEQWASFRTSIESVFGETDLQYDLAVDNFLERVEVHFELDEEDDEGNKKIDTRILSISYNPMWNDDEELVNLMMVVEDITEQEKLAAEIAKQKATSEKNISIIKEMANADLDDISVFLKNAPELVEKSLELARIADKNPEVMAEMFRHLHTLKGNARAFNFNSISSLTHVAETAVVNIREGHKKGESVTQEMFIPIIGQLYDINTEIKDYGALAKKVFRIENEFENKLVNEAQNFTVALDQDITRYVTNKEMDFDVNQPDEVRGKAFEELKSNPPKKSIIEQIKRSAHSLKGTLRSLNKPEISEVVHKLEAAFPLLEDIGNADQDEFSKEFISNYVEIKDAVRATFQQSDLNRPYSHEGSDWINIFVTIHEFSSSIEWDNTEELMGSINLIEKLFSDCSGLKLQFLTRISSDLFAILKSGPDNYKAQIEDIKSLVAELWRYVALVSRLSIATLDNEDDIKRVSSELKDLGGDLDKVRNKIENLDISGPFIIGTMRHLTRIKKSPQDFFTESEKYGVKYDDFMCGTEKVTDLNYILADLKTSRLINGLPKGTKDLAEKGDSVAEALRFGIESNPFYIYLKLIDYAQLLNGFNQEEEEGKDAGIKKVQTIAVVARNYNRLKQVMDSEADESEPKRLFNRLLDVPIVPSLSKFGSMVKDISTKLNKQVDFNIQGGEVTMNKDSYYLLQDAFVHILRNSLDHGIEDPDQRKTNGKNPKGIININCKEIDADNIEIRIKDDGKGINHEIIAKKAVEKNIHTPDEVKGMSEHDLVSLIFLPSFSQKDEVSELSGRGVGMDVVKKNLQKLGGDIDVATKVGEGTEFILKFKASA